MSNLGLAAFVAGMGNGIIKAQQSQEDRQLQEKRLAMEQARADREEQQYQDQRGLQQALKDAYAPRSAVQGLVVGAKGNQALYDKSTLTPALAESLQAEADMRAGGDTPAGAPPSLMPARAGYGIVGTSKGNLITDTAPDVAGLNTMEAGDKRAQVVLAQGGKRLEAMQLEKAGLDLTKANQDAADQATRRQISALGSHQEIADWVTKTKGDGKGGALKMQAVVSPDGKSVVYHTVNDDGTTTPTAKSFKNDDAGLEEARTTLAGYMTPEMRQAHFKDLRELDRKVKADDNKYAYQLAIIETKKEAAQALIAAAQARAEASGQKFQAGVVLAPLLATASKSLHDAEKRIDDYIKDPLVKINLAKKDSPESKRLQALEDEADLIRQEKALYQSGLAKTIGLAGVVREPKPTISNTVPPLPPKPSTNAGLSMPPKNAQPAAPTLLQAAQALPPLTSTLPPSQKTAKPAYFDGADQIERVSTGRGQPPAYVYRGTRYATPELAQAAKEKAR